MMKVFADNVVGTNNESEALLLKNREDWNEEAERLASTFVYFSDNDTDRQLILSEMYRLWTKYSTIEILEIIGILQLRWEGIKSVVFGACYALTFFDKNEIVGCEEKFASLIALFLLDKHENVVSLSKTILEFMITESLQVCIKKRIVDMNDDNNKSRLIHLISKFLVLRNDL